MADASDDRSVDAARPGPARPEAELDADARALASVLRVRILRLCLDQALTNKQIATRLGKDPATIYHHVRMLADRGFLAAQPERRGARGAREVPYLATRRSWRTPMGPPGTRILVEAFLEELAEADPATVQSTRLGVRVKPEAYKALMRRVGELFQEFADLPPDPDGVPYSMFFAIHEDAARRERAEE